jgi:hypothetical protein
MGIFGKKTAKNVHTKFMQTFSHVERSETFMLNMINGPKRWQNYASKTKNQLPNILCLLKLNLQKPFSKRIRKLKIILYFEKNIVYLSQ